MGSRRESPEAVPEAARNPAPGRIEINRLPLRVTHGRSPAQSGFNGGGCVHRPKMAIRRIAGAMGWRNV